MDVDISTPPLPSTSGPVPALMVIAVDGLVRRSWLALRPLPAETLPLAYVPVHCIVSPEPGTEAGDHDEATSSAVVLLALMKVPLLPAPLVLVETAVPRPFSATTR